MQQKHIIMHEQIICSFMDIYDNIEPCDPEI